MQNYESFSIWRMGNALKALQETIPKEWLLVLDETHQLLVVLPADGGQTLYAFWKRLRGRRSKRNQTRSALEQLRDLLLRLIQDWQRYCTFQSASEIPGSTMRPNMRVVT
jgi:hypothetical protein